MGKAIVDGGRRLTRADPGETRPPGEPVCYSTLHYNGMQEHSTSATPYAHWCVDTCATACYDTTGGRKIVRLPSPTITGVWTRMLLYTLTLRDAGT